MKYIKSFKTQEEYNNYKNSEQVLSSNMLLHVKDKSLHYGRLGEVFVKYLVKNSTEPTRLYFHNEVKGEGQPLVQGKDNFDEIIIDGIEFPISYLDKDMGFYKLTEGEHNVSYALKDSTNLRMCAFMNCTEIINVKISSAVTTIGNGSFANCSGLTSFDVTANVTRIGKSAFCNCTNLSSVTIGENVTNIECFAFGGCNSITSVTIPNSVEDIGIFAFHGCNKLINLIIEAENVPKLGYGAFDSTNNCPIYVPRYSTSKYFSDENWNCYSSRIKGYYGENIWIS